MIDLYIDSYKINMDKESMAKYSSIQITPKTKEALRRKGKMGESYEDIIKRLLKIKENKK